MDQEQTNRFLKQIIIGCDYLSLLQDRSTQIGHKEGSIIHEVTKNGQVILGDMAQFEVAIVSKTRFASCQWLFYMRRYIGILWSLDRIQCFLWLCSGTCIIPGQASRPTILILSPSTAVSGMNA
jgi:hypothetical protein